MNVLMDTNNIEPYNTRLNKYNTHWMVIVKRGNNELQTMEAMLE